MTTQSESELAVAKMLVDVLGLEDINASEIDPTEALFADGLGLDSIDALEIALAISQEHGVQMKAEDEDTQEAFASLRSLSAFIERNK